MKLDTLLATNIFGTPLRSMIKYLIVGFSTFGLDYLFNWLLIEVVGVSYLLVGYIATPFVLAFNFSSHKFWTYRDVGSADSDTKRQMWRYLTLVAVSAVVNMLLMMLFYDYVALPLLWARVACTGVGIMLTFPVQRFWVYAT